jgi:hypothetical protein
MAFPDTVLNVKGNTAHCALSTTAPAVRVGLSLSVKPLRSTNLTVVRFGAVRRRHERSGWGLTAGGTPADACLPRERTVAGRPGPLPRPRSLAGDPALASSRGASAVVRHAPGAARPRTPRPRGAPLAGAARTQLGRSLTFGRARRRWMPVLEAMVRTARTLPLAACGRDRTGSPCARPPRRRAGACGQRRSERPSLACLPHAAVHRTP